jgi:hypothetical protein
MCLAFALFQKTFSSTEIMFDFKHTPTDKEIIATIEDAHRRGVKVCLKPVLNCRDGVWRALINFPDADMMGKDNYWDTWFDSYGAFIAHYAEIARDTGCEMFCLGCEMSGTERKDSHWRALIERIRGIYSGPLVYNTNHGNETQIKWFDAIDYIGTSAYYPVAKEPGASKETMVEAWKTVREKLADVSRTWGNKPILFLEIGCRSALGCATMPWDFTHREFPANEDEQANFYDSCLEVFDGEPWFCGAFWWDWSTKIYDTREVAVEDTGFNVHLKKAEDVLRKWYKG